MCTSEDQRKYIEYFDHEKRGEILNILIMKKGGNILKNLIMKKGGNMLKILIMKKRGMY